MKENTEILSVKKTTPLLSNEEEKGKGETEENFLNVHMHVFQNRISSMNKMHRKRHNGFIYRRNVTEYCNSNCLKQLSKETDNCIYKIMKYKEASS